MGGKPSISCSEQRRGWQWAGTFHLVLQVTVWLGIGLRLTFQVREGLWWLETHIWSKGGVVWAGNPTVSHFEQGRSGRNLKNNMRRMSPPRHSRD